MSTDPNNRMLARGVAESVRYMTSGYVPRRSCGTCGVIGFVMGAGVAVAAVCLLIWMAR